MIFNENFRNFSKEKSKKIRPIFFWPAKFQNALTLRMLRFFSSDQKHSSRNCLKFADTKYLVLKVDSRGEKKILKSSDTESRNSTQKLSNFVKSHYISIRPASHISFYRKSLALCELPKFSKVDRHRVFSRVPSS